MRLQDKVVVVTGASQGIGREIALECARQGATLVLAARSQAKLERTAQDVVEIGRQAMVVATDVTDESAVAAMSNSVLKHLGHVDVLVNNSGIAGPSAPLWEVSPDDWAKTMAVNVTGVFLCCRALLPSMTKRGSGSIINIGSITGKRPLLNRTAYATSKAALIGLTRTLAEEVGPYGIRVNLISPGAVEGQRIDRVFEMQAQAQGRSAAEIRAQFESLAPLKRLVDASDIARSVVFLASDDSSGITGVDLNVTAGAVMY